MLYGAFLGDMIGVPFEFLPCTIRNFPIFTPYTRYSDDSVMTMAVAEAMIMTHGYSEEDALPVIVEQMQKYGKKYPGAGYGAGFGGWIYQKDPKPYGSWGNGSAMRVSSVGWFYDTLEETEERAKWTAEVTHNHPEGIKGAQATASAIFLARTGHSKKEIKEYSPLIKSVVKKPYMTAYRPLSKKFGFIENLVLKYFDSSGYGQLIEVEFE